MVRDCSVQLLGRGTNHEIDIESAQMAMAPQYISDTVHLSISNEELKTLLKYIFYKDAADFASQLQWKHLEVFFTCISQGKQKKNNTYFSIPYIECKFAVDMLLNISLRNLEKIEDLCKDLSKNQLMEEKAKIEEGLKTTEESRSLG